MKTCLSRIPRILSSGAYRLNGKALYKLAAIQLMESCSGGTVSGRGLVDMFSGNCANACYDGGGLLVGAMYYSVSACDDYHAGRITVTRE